MLLKTCLTADVVESKMRPSIDHGLLSPSGHMSKRARKAAMDRETERLFGGENKITMADLRKAHLAAIQPSKWEALRRSAANLRDLAARGMKPRAYPKMAAAMEAEADRLEAGAQPPNVIGGKRARTK